MRYEHRAKASAVYSIVSEFTLISQYCQDLGVEHHETRIGIGDDAAVVTVPVGMELAISVDTMVEGIHFFPDVDPATLAHKLLAVNLSDMAAMGAEPKWATLALTLAKPNDAWLSAFSMSLDKSAKRCGVQLIGGDTTQGPLTLSMQIMGLLPKGKALSRTDAKPGEYVYVTNTVGDAALALAYRQHAKQLEGMEFADTVVNRLTQALELPEPQIAVGQALLKHAGACIDVSDGLVADLTHLAEQSGVSIELDVNRVPLSDDYQRYLRQGGNLQLALTGGDDYQLAFTASPKHAKRLRMLEQSLGVSLTNIGKVVERAAQPLNLLAAGVEYKLSREAGYQHFKESK